MDLGFVLTLPSDLERFEPLARRLPGSGFVLAPGRWPSAWLDSRRWLERSLRARRRHCEPARRQFSLLVAPAGLPARSIAPWAAPGARLLRLRAADPRFGDPRLDAAFEVGAAVRARRTLGLSGERPIRLIVSGDPERQLARFAAVLASMRSEAELVVMPSESAWLRSGHRLPRALQGPGIAILREEIPWAELLAACECVMGDDLPALVDAMRLGKPAMLLSDVPPTAPQFPRADDQVLRDALDLLPIVIEPAALHAAIGSLPNDWRERELLAGSQLRRLRKRCDGHAAARMARALARQYSRLAIDRVLDELTV